MIKETKLEPANADPTVQTVYDLRFLCAYMANTSMMVAISLLFRIEDFVTFNGGDLTDLGRISAVGVVGSLLTRLYQGRAIDATGPKKVHLFSTALFMAACAGHLLIHDSRAWPVYALRVIYSVSIAGAFGASITYISMRAPIHRLAEVLGTLGTSGFVGMVAGPWVGDLIFGGQPASQTSLTHMFLTACGLGLVGLAFGQMAMWRAPKPAPHEHVPVVRVMKQFHPGLLLMVGVAAGFGLVLPGVYLRPYAKELGIHTLGEFFTVYACAAFVVRLVARSLPDKIGVKKTASSGLVLLVLSTASFASLPVLMGQGLPGRWLLVFPAVMVGLAHAMIFPSVVGGGSVAFPARFRGLGTTLMLATFDLGQVTGSFVAGELFHALGYAQTFLLLSGLLAVVAAVYLLFARPPQLPTAGQKMQSLAADLGEVLAAPEIPAEVATLAAEANGQLPADPQPLCAELQNSGGVHPATDPASGENSRRGVSKQAIAG